MANTGYYVYGITWNESLPDRKEDVFIVPLDRISAVVSEVSLEEFSEVPLRKNLESLDWVREKAFRHERVIEEVMKRNTIIPMMFCTIFTGKEGILKLLKEKHNYFMGLLEKYRDKHEWGVKVYCRKKETASVKDPGSGREYLMSKKAREEKSLEDERDVNARIEEIFRNIRPLAEDARINRPTPKELLQDRSKEQVLNVSFLVPDRSVEELTLLVDDLAKMYSKNGLTLELVGPLPIYSFVGGEKDE